MIILLLIIILNKSNIRELIPTLLLNRERLIGSKDFLFYLLTEENNQSFIMIISLSLAKREIRESSK